MTSTDPNSLVIPIVMPDFGNSMEEGTLLGWKVSEGDSVTVGDILCEVETDKAVMEYESPAAGRLARIVAQNGEVVPVQQPIAYLADSDDAVVKFLNTEDVATNDPEPAFSMVAPQPWPKSRTNWALHRRSPTSAATTCCPA